LAVARERHRPDNLITRQATLLRIRALNHYGQTIETRRVGWRVIKLSGRCRSRATAKRGAA